MQAIRIEHPSNGIGFFQQRDERLGVMRNYSVFNDLIQRHCRTPTPWHEYKEGTLPRDRTADDFCAFKSIRQIREWFEQHELNELFRMGYEIYLLELDICAVGAFQILFRKENIIEKKVITGLFK